MAVVVVCCRLLLSLLLAHAISATLTIHGVGTQQRLLLDLQMHAHDTVFGRFGYWRHAFRNRHLAEGALVDGGAA